MQMWKYAEMIIQNARIISQNPITILHDAFTGVATTFTGNSREGSEYI
jgi:hypothetical protein